MRKENIYIKSLHTSAVKPRDCGGASRKSIAIQKHMDRCQLDLPA